MSCNVLEIKLEDKHIIKDLGLFINGKIQGYPLRPQKSENSQSEPFVVQENYKEMRGEASCRKLSTKLQRDHKKIRFLPI